MKKTFIALAAFGFVCIGSTNAMDADIAGCYNIAVVKQKCQQARAAAMTVAQREKLDLMDRDVDALVSKDGGLVNEIRAQHKARIADLVNTYVGGDGDNLLAATAIVGGLNQPADRTLGAFKTAINAIVDAAACPAAVFPPKAKYDIITLTAIVNPITQVLVTDITNFMEALGGAAGTVVLDGAVGVGGGYPQPADGQRNTFRDIILESISRA